MTEHSVDEESVPFFPTHFLTEARLAFGLLAILVVLASIGIRHPPEIGPVANPLDTPLHIKPEWYFLAFYQLLKYVPETAGTAVPIVLVGLLLWWPFLDRRPDRSRRAYRLRAGAVGAVLAVAAVLSYLAWIS